MKEKPPGWSPIERLDALAELRKSTEPTFKTLGEGCYRFYVPSLQASLEVDFLRRDGGQLKGEVLVRCEVAGARSVDGVLTVSDLNFSSTRTRSSFAKDCAELARSKVDGWRTVIEEFALRILSAERGGEPAVWLHDVLPPAGDRLLYVDGFPLLELHPLILFGDGGTGKSLLALYFAGHLAQKGHRVGLFDWELDAPEHRLRLGQLFSASPLPRIRYVRCSRPLRREVERLRKVVRGDDLDFVVFDSVGYACEGPPESAEAAMGYFQALRTIGRVGSLHIAHVKRGEGGEHQPFGSVYFANSARSTWNVQQASRESGDSGLQLALHHRKFNTTAKMRSVGFEIAFEPERITISPLDLGSVPDLAAKLSLRERVQLALKHGPLSREDLRAELDDIPDNRFRSMLSKEKAAGRVLDFPGGRLSLPSGDIYGGS